VKAKVHTLNGFSAHADQRDLIKWAENFQTNPLFIITHGEQKSSEMLSILLKNMGFEVLIPSYGQSIDLTKREITKVIEKKPYDWEEIIKELEDELLKIKTQLIYPNEESLDLLKAVLILLKNIKK
jgi:metallo-beta-lactamase family protein